MTYTAIDRRRMVDRSYRRRYDLAQLHGIPTSPLPAGPVTAHVRELHALGWSTEALSHATGLAVSNTAILNLLNTDQPTVHRATAAALLGLPITLRVDPRIPDVCKVPTLGATRRIQALMRLGWSHDAMQGRYGFDTQHFARGTYRQSLARKIRAAEAMYDDLCMTVGVSRKTMTYARNARWQPPLAWWDIDDPHEAPDLGRGQVAGAVVDRTVVTRLLYGERVPSTKAEKEEAMRRWIAGGKSARSLALIHGWQEGRYTQRGEEIPA